MDLDSKKDIMEMQELFEKHDKDGDGYLTLMERGAGIWVC